MKPAVRGAPSVKWLTAEGGGRYSPRRARQAFQPPGGRKKSTPTPDNAASAATQATEHRGKVRLKHSEAVDALRDRSRAPLPNDSQALSPGPSGFRRRIGATPPGVFFFRAMTLDLTASPAAPPRRRGRFLATVVANVPVCREHNRLTFRIDGFPASQPGQFVQIRCRDVDAAPLGEFQERQTEWVEPVPPALHASDQPDLRRPMPILRRPFSIAGRRSTPQGEEIDLINREIGPGTSWLYRLTIGQDVDLIGPLGNTFTLPQPGATALLVGGGVGIPPMIYIAQSLAELNAGLEGRQRRGAIAFCGALSIDLMPLTITDRAAEPRAGQGAGAPRENVLEFAQFGFPTVLSTDDGSYGFHGRVTGALERVLDKLPSGSAPPILYTCGPEAMMKAVAGIARERGLECQVAVERAMACGMGTCQSCVIRQVADTERGWRYRLACTDGPIFEASTLLW